MLAGADVGAAVPPMTLIQLLCFKMAAVRGFDGFTAQPVFDSRLGVLWSDVGSNFACGKFGDKPRIIFRGFILGIDACDACAQIGQLLL